MPMPNDNEWLRRLMFLGYGDWIGYVVAAIIAMLIFGLRSLKDFCLTRGDAAKLLVKKITQSVMYVT